MAQDERYQDPTQRMIDAIASQHGVSHKQAKRIWTAAKAQHPRSPRSRDRANGPVRILKTSPQHDPPRSPPTALTP